MVYFGPEQDQTHAVAAAMARLGKRIPRAPAAV